MTTASERFMGHSFRHRIDPETPPWWTIDGFLSRSECAAVAELIEAAPREVATINTGRGMVRNTSVRNNTRVMFDDPALAARLWPRARPHVPAQLGAGVAVGLNERFRCYRYAAGQYFAPHRDGAFVRDRSERSLLTFLVYLNHDFEGGETAFLVAPAAVIAPRTGCALVFQHPLPHEGRPVAQGVKYVLRTDVMYRYPVAPARTGG